MGELCKLAERERRDKNMILTHNLCVMTQQKTELSTYSQSLLKQLTEERQKSHKLTLRIRKYSKNVKSLHKKTHSLSGLNKYKMEEQNIPCFGPLASRSTSASSNNQFTLDIVDDEDFEINSKNTELQKKRMELKELEEQTLKILNELQEETRVLMGASKDLSKLSTEKREKRKRRKRKKKKKKKKKIKNPPKKKKKKKS